MFSPIVATTLGLLVAVERFTTAQAIGLALAIGALIAGQFVARPARGRIIASREPSSAAAFDTLR